MKNKNTNMGIYQIENIKTNYKYIGQTKNLSSRFIGHINALRHGIHGNSRLQNSWNMYGEEFFDYQVLEYVDDPRTLHEKEMQWIKKLENEKLFNGRYAQNGTTSLHIKTGTKLISISVSNEEYRIYKSIASSYGISIQRLIKDYLNSFLMENP